MDTIYYRHRIVYWDTDFSQIPISLPLHLLCPLRGGGGGRENKPVKQFAFVALTVWLLFLTRHFHADIVFFSLIISHPSRHLFFKSFLNCYLRYISASEVLFISAQGSICKRLLYIASLKGIVRNRFLHSKSETLVW